MSGGVTVDIDLRRLRQTAAECGWSLAEFVEFYAPRARDELAQLEAAAAGREETAPDETAVSRLAHGAAGSSESVGATSLSVLYRRIEQGARTATPAALSQLLSALRLHLEDVLTALDELARAGD